MSSWNRVELFVVISSIIEKRGNEVLTGLLEENEELVVNFNDKDAKVDGIFESNKIYPARGVDEGLFVVLSTVDDKTQKYKSSTWKFLLKNSMYISLTV